MRAASGAAVLFALATVVLTWPLFRHPATTVLAAPSVYAPPASLFVQSDLNLTMWVLAWDTHALVTHPSRLFDANTFYPALSTLACSEHMLGNVPLFGPVYLATGNPVLAHQATLLASFVLAGLAMGAYVLYWSGDRPSALAAGFLYAYAPFRLWQLGDLHVISTQYLPLVMLSIDATLDRGGGRWPVALAVALVLSSLVSYYVGYAAFFLAVVYLMAGVIARGRRALGRLPSLVLALATAAAAVAAVSVPYLLLQRRRLIPHYEALGFANVGFVGMMRFGLRGLLWNYLVPGRDVFPHFLTYTALALAVVALLRHRRHPRAALVAVAIGGIVLGLGPVLFTSWGVVPLPYQLFARIVPGFSAMRVPYRFGALASLGVVSLAGLGLAATRRFLHDRGRTRLAAVLPVLVIATGLVESTPRGLRSTPMMVGEGVPAAYRWLAAHGDGGPLLELPTRPGGPVRESLAMYYSTFHWLPIVNGYTAYPPRSYLDIMKAARHLPAPEALAAILERVGLRWILVHRGEIPAARWPDWEHTLDGALRPVAVFGSDLLFEVGG